MRPVLEHDVGRDCPQVLEEPVCRAFGGDAIGSDMAGFVRTAIPLLVYAGASSDADPKTCTPTPKC